MELFSYKLCVGGRTSRSVSWGDGSTTRATSEVTFNKKEKKRSLAPQNLHGLNHICECDLSYLGILLIDESDISEYNLNHHVGDYNKTVLQGGEDGGSAATAHAI